MARLRHLLPSLNALVTFEAAVRCGTFARAANELCVTGPAVSRTIGRLEAHLGVALFHRTSAGAVLTEEGSALFSGISASFDEIEKTLLRVQQARRFGVLGLRDPLVHATARRLPGTVPEGRYPLSVDQRTARRIRQRRRYRHALRPRQRRAPCGATAHAGTAGADPRSAFPRRGSAGR